MFQFQMNLIQDEVRILKKIAQIERWEPLVAPRVGIFLAMLALYDKLKVPLCFGNFIFVEDKTVPLYLRGAKRQHLHFDWMWNILYQIDGEKEGLQKGWIIYAYGDSTQDTKKVQSLPTASLLVQLAELESCRYHLIL